MKPAISLIVMLAAPCAIAQAQAQAINGTSLALTAPASTRFANDQSGTRVSIFPVAPGLGDPFTSADSVQLGGMADFNGGSALAIRGAPYGYYDTGTLLSIVSTAHSLANARAGINSGYDGYPAGLVAMAKYPELNSVNFYNQTSALPPRMILGTGVTYTPTQIRLAVPLTAAQRSQLRPSMWITTNSIDPTMASLVSGTLASAASSGDSALTLSGSVKVAVGSYVRGFHAGLNGPTVTVTDVTVSNGNTVVGLSAPLVDGGTDAAPMTAYPAGTRYGFMTYNTPVATSVATSVGSSTLTLSGVYAILPGTAIPAGNPGIAPGTTITSSVVSGYTTALTLSQPVIADAANDPAYPVGTTLYIGLPGKFPTGQHVPSVTYASTITGWDTAGGATINVNGWTVPGSQRPTGGQVPSGLFDPAMPYTDETAYIGTPTTATINNWVQSYDPGTAPSGGAAPGEGETSRIQQFEGLELDQWNFAKRDYEATFRGLTIGYTPLGKVTSGGVSHGVLPTTDSYDLQLAGNMPTLLRFTGASSANYLLGESLLVRGNGGVTGAAGNTGELFEHSAFMDGADNFRLVDWLQKDSNAVGAGGGSMHLGLILNGAQGSVGTPQSQITFNVPGAGPGSIGLFGYGGGGFYTDTVGNSFVTPNNTLLFKTAANANGGGIGTDAAGDLLLGSSKAGAQIISTAPFLAQGGLLIQGRASGNAITAPSMLVRGNGGVGGAAGATGELFEQSGFMDGSDNFRLVDWLQKDSSAVGAGGGSMHLGLILNGAQGSVGTPQSQLMFNVPAAGPGSIGLFGYGGGGFYTDTVGNSFVTPNNTLLFKTAANANGGSIGTDAAGDLLLGSSKPGAQTISTSPLLVQGGLALQGSAATSLITAPSMLVRGNGGVGGAAGATGELFEQSGFMDGADNFRLIDWLQKDSNAVGAGGGSMHLGLILNGVQGSVGTPQSQITFNVPGAGPGSVGMFGYNGGGLYTDTTGTSFVTPNNALVFKTAANGNGGALNSDSAGDLLLGSRNAGAQTISTAPFLAQNGLAIQNGVNAAAITAPSLLVRGNAGVTGAAGNTGELFEHSGFMDGSDNFRLVGWLQKDTQATGASGGSLRLGLILNGAQGSVAAPQSQLLFNVPGAGPGSIGLFGYGGGGLYTDTTGNSFVTPNNVLLFKTAANANGGSIGTNASGDVVLGSVAAGGRVLAGKPLVLPSFPYAALPATGTAGTELLCTDCLKPGEAAGAGTGMVVFDDGHARWVSMAGTVAAR